MADLFAKPFASDILDSPAFGQSLVRSSSAAELRSLSGVTSFANSWTAKQTYPTNQSSADPFLAFTPDATVDTENNSFSMGARSYDFTTYKNNVWRMGHNMDPAGVAMNAARGVIKDEWESKYEQFGVFNCERHCVFAKPGGSDQRFMTFNGSWTTTTPTNNALGFYVERLRHRNAANDTDYWQCDSGVGFQIGNWPVGITHTSTNQIPLTINVPTAQAADYFRVVNGNGALWRISQKGELIINTAAAASGASAEQASLYVQGRVGTNYNFYVTASDGNARMRVSQATGAVGSIAFNSNFDNFGSFTQWNSAGSTLNFQIGGTGLIRTNQTSAGGPAGSVVGKVPFYDNAGTLVGYAELKALT